VSPTAGPTQPDPPDADLVRRFQSGDHTAFVSLMERHERKVFNLAYRMLGRAEDARDATQDAFLSCFRHLSRFRGESAFGTWLHRIAVNACYDILRKRPPEQALQDEMVEPPPSPDHADQTALAADVQRALLEVSPDFRAVIVMHDVQDLPLDEIAVALDVPIGTVKSRLHRGRAALGRALAREPERVPGPSKPPTP
jgi:RNA polymerase sigma-70 factor (ECF subfamily)